MAKSIATTRTCGRGSVLRSCRKKLLFSRSRVRLAFELERPVAGTPGTYVPAHTSTMEIGEGVRGRLRIRTARVTQQQRPTTNAAAVVIIKQMYRLCDHLKQDRRYDRLLECPRSA